MRRREGKAAEKSQRKMSLTKAAAILQVLASSRPVRETEEKEALAMAADLLRSMREAEAEAEAAAESWATARERNGQAAKLEMYEDAWRAAA